MNKLRGSMLSQLRVPDQMHEFCGRSVCQVSCCLPIMQVGISSVWYEGNPCNMHLNDLAADVKRGVEESGLPALKSITSAFSMRVANHADVFQAVHIAPGTVASGSDRAAHEI